MEEIKMTINVTVWNEFRHEKTEEKVKRIYPKGIHETIRDFLGEDKEIIVQTATLDEPEHGLTEDVLEKTDVLIWWGHSAHDEVTDVVVERVYEQVLRGMGLIVLHSAHYSKIFKRLMGTTCSLRWRDVGERERLWVIEQNHPITRGIPEYIDLPHEEMYGERFDIPDPEKVLFLGWFEGGEVFRAGITYTRGNGKIFYFQPGHETYPQYRNPLIQKVIKNAVYWAKPERKYPKYDAFFADNDVDWGDFDYLGDTPYPKFG